MRWRCAATWGLAAALLAAGCGDRYEMIAWWNEVRGDAYALDDIPRETGDSTAAQDEKPPDPVECPDVSLSTYEGKEIPYEGPVRVAEPFEDKLHELERVVVDVAREHYGRSPRRLLHFGAFACRSIRGRPSRLSEHALGNAIDVSGFSFPAAAKDEVPQDLPERLRGPFVVSVQRHWDAETDEPGAVHGRFLRDLIDRLQSQGLFRGIIGPGQPGHGSHFHFDYSPWSYTRL